MPSTAITALATSRKRVSVINLIAVLALLASGLILPAPGQQPVNPSSMPPPPQQPQKPAEKGSDQGYRIRRDVDLVVLHATVLDDKGDFVPDLKLDNFRVYEDKVEQKLSLFKREDIPVTMGLVIDNSGSMRSKRARVNIAALTFVKTSNPQDEVFVVNFNDEYYLDLDKEFTNDQKELREALERVDSRGSTAFYDALIGSLDHVKKGTRDKKVLLVITDGEDNASRKTFEYTVQAAQQSDAMIYAVGLFADEEKKEARHATKVLKTLTEATGGLAYFPKDVEAVESICTKMAHDIRNQYLLAYYPTNTRKDGSFRSVQVQVLPPRGRSKMSVRTRTGYYAQRESGAQ